MSNEVAVRDAELAAIAAQQEASIDQEDLTVPMMKVAQALTREVKDGNAVPGEFVNTLLGEGVGTKIGFIIVDHSKGRVAEDKKAKRYYVSNDFYTIPDSWKDFVGEAFIGTRFDEHPDADETFRAAVNNEERQWESGPPIKTTHIYTGYAVVPAEEGSEDEFELQPVRLSIKVSNRSAKETISAINSLKNLKLRGKPFWDRVFDLSTKEQSFGGGDAYVINVKLGRQTTEDERQAAMELYQAVQAGRVQDNAEEAESAAATKVAPDAEGGLAV